MLWLTVSILMVGLIANVKLDMKVLVQIVVISMNVREGFITAVQIVLVSTIKVTIRVNA